MKTRHLKNFLVCFALVASACTKAEKYDETELTKEVSEQPARAMHGQMAEKGVQAILESESLTVDEKDQILKIYGGVAEKTFVIQDETSQLLGVLFETMTKRPYNAKKIEGLKERLVALNTKKMNVMFQGMDEVRKVVDKSAFPDKIYPEIYRPFIMETAKK